MRHRHRGERPHPVGVPGGQRPRDVRAPVVPDDVGHRDVERRHQVRRHLRQVLHGVGVHLVRGGRRGSSRAGRARRCAARPAPAAASPPPSDADVCGKPCSSSTGRPSSGPSARTSKVRSPTSTRSSSPPMPRTLAGRRRRPPTALPSAPVSSPERDFVPAHLDDLHADLDAWLRIPSISADPAHAPDVAASAAWLADALRRTGFPTVEIWPTAGRARRLRRVAVGRRRRARRARLRPPRRPAGRPAGAVGAPAVRAHPGRGPRRPRAARPRRDRRQGQRRLPPARHARAPGRHRPRHPRGDGQAADRGRGGVRARRTSPPCCEQRRDRLACDVVVVSDTGMAAPDVPERGHRDARPGRRRDHPARPGRRPALRLLRRRRPQPAARHGDAARRACTTTRAASPCPASTTRSARSSDRERELMGRVPFDEQAWLAGPAASRATDRRGGLHARSSGPAPGPTAEVNGMWGGYTGPGHKTIIPAEAHAKVTFRLVADQRPEDVAAQVRAWVEANLPDGIEADVHTPPGGVAPCASDLDSPAMDALLRAIAQAFDTEPADVLFTREGGSGPEADLVEVARRPAALPRRRAAHRPHPLAERARAAADALPRRGGGGAPVARARRGALLDPGADDDGRAELVVGDHPRPQPAARRRRPPRPAPGSRWSRTAASRRRSASRAPRRRPAGRRPDRPRRRRARAAVRGRAPPAAWTRSRCSGRRGRWPGARRRGRAARDGSASNRSPAWTEPPTAATLRRAHATAAGSRSAACSSTAPTAAASATPRAPEPQQRSTTTAPGRARDDASRTRTSVRRRGTNTPGSTAIRSPQNSTQPEDVLEREPGHPAVHEGGELGRRAAPRPSAAGPRPRRRRSRPRGAGRRRRPRRAGQRSCRLPSAEAGTVPGRRGRRGTVAAPPS